MTVPIVINTENPHQAWLTGVDHLLEKGDVYNLVTHIMRPQDFEIEAIKSITPRRLSRTFQSTSDVINTIFPIRLWQGDRHAFYARYLEIHDRANDIHSRTAHRWGTYFERMIRFGESEKNQLEDCIGAINSWKHNHHAALVIHTSSCDVDSTRKIIGNPCLQFLEFICPTDDTVSLSVVYRNHDYFGKVLGNFVGLACLLDFVATETGRSSGTLTCFAAHAYHEESKRHLRALAGR